MTSFIGSLVFQPNPVSLLCCNVTLVHVTPLYGEFRRAGMFPHLTHWSASRSAASAKEQKNSKYLLNMWVEIWLVAWCCICKKTEEFQQAVMPECSRWSTCLSSAFLHFFVSSLSSHHLFAVHSTPHTRPSCRTCCRWPGRCPFCRPHTDPRWNQRPRWVALLCMVEAPWADGTQLWSQIKGVFFIY